MTDRVLQIVIAELQTKSAPPPRHSCGFQADARRVSELLSYPQRQMGKDQKHKVYVERGGKLSHLTLWPMNTPN